MDKLLMRDLLLDQKLEDISKRAVPSREAPSEPPSYLSNSVVSDINLRDIGIEEQLEKISRNTIKQVWGWKPTKIQSDVTKEMIQEYQDELERSSYQDPITGRKFKYLPVNTDFTLEEPELLQVIPFQDFKKIDEEKRQLVKLYQVTESRINQMREEIKAAEPKPTYQEAKRAERAGVSPENYFGERYFLIRFEEQTQKLQKRIDEDIGRLKEIEARLYGLDKSMAISKENEQSNQAEVDRVRKSNRELLKQKSDELNLLNRGKMNIQQQPNESDEDFKQRLLDVGQVEFDETYIEEAAGRRALERFKQNMKSIIRNNTLVEQMIKLVIPSRLFEYNKFFSLILKKFEEVYGKAKLTEDNAQELIDFFDNVLAQDPFYRNFKGMPENIAAYRELTQGVREEEDLEARAVGGHDPSKSKGDIIGDSLGLPPIAAFPQIYSQGAAEEPRQAEAITPTIAISFNPYKMTKEQLILDFSDRYNANAARGQLLTSNENGKSPSKVTILQRLLQKGIIETADTYALSPQKVSSQTRIESFFGKGFLEELPKFAPFGRIAINPRALYYDNNLIVLNHNKHHINGYNKVKVSDHFVNAIMKLLNHEIPKHEDLKHFDLKEKELYDMVIHLAGLHKRVEHNLDRTKQSMKHRFELLDGEINAGNDNHSIKKELKDLVHKMAYAGMISHHEAHQYLYPNMRYVKHKKAPKSKK